MVNRGVVEQTGVLPGDLLPLIDVRALTVAGERGKAMPDGLDCGERRRHTNEAEVDHQAATAHVLTSLPCVSRRHRSVRSRSSGNGGLLALRLNRRLGGLVCTEEHTASGQDVIAASPEGPAA